MSEFEGHDDRIDRGQGDVTLTGQTSVGIQTGLGVSQRIELESTSTLLALAMKIMRFEDPITGIEKQLNQWRTEVEARGARAPSLGKNMTGEEYRFRKIRDTKFFSICDGPSLRKLGPPPWKISAYATELN